MTIHKHHLEVTRRQAIETSATSEILCVQLQCGSPVLYALTDPAMPRVPRVIATYGTGNEVPDRGRRRYIGTYMLERGAQVYHVFEEFNTLEDLCDTRLQTAAETRPAKAASGATRERALCAAW